MASQWIALGWGNQSPVALYSDGRLEVPPGEVEAQDLGAYGGQPGPLSVAGAGFYRMARIVNDQIKNPFEEGKVNQSLVGLTIEHVTGVLAALASGEVEVLSISQGMQLQASAGVVLLSLAESQQGRASEKATRIASRAMEAYFSLIDSAVDPLLEERLAMNLDWVIPSLPEALADRARDEMEARIPQWPPYDAWFADGNTRLNIDWKCGPEFIDGWLRRLQGEGFELVSKGLTGMDSVLERTFAYQGQQTQVRLTIGPVRDNVFRYMNQPDVHVVGYDGHSDWGRKIPQSLEYAPAQEGAKAILYLLCSGKQILQKVRDIYAKAHIVTTFNSARFTKDFTYSEDFTAFMHILRGFSKRQSWEEIRQRVNGDWRNNPHQNYIFPIESLAMARSLDQDHDGQSDVFDLLIDYNTFSVEADTRSEFIPRQPERGPHELVGTALHLGVQVFHTLAHFNQLLEPFSRELRVFSGGYFDPAAPPRFAEVDLGPTRIRVEREQGQIVYRISCSHHHAHASEEAWRALITFSLGVVVMNTEQRFAQFPPHHTVLNPLLTVAHGLEVDDAPGRDEAVWAGLVDILELPLWLDRYRFVSVKKLDPHWYAGSRRSLKAMDDALSDAKIAELETWLERLR